MALQIKAAVIHYLILVINLRTQSNSHQTFLITVPIKEVAQKKEVVEILAILKVLNYEKMECK